MSKSHLCMTHDCPGVNFSVANGSKSHIFAYKFSLHYSYYEIVEAQLDFNFIFHSLISNLSHTSTNSWRDALQQI